MNTPVVVYEIETKLFIERMDINRHTQYIQTLIRELILAFGVQKTAEYIRPRILDPRWLSYYFSSLYEKPP